MIDNDALKRHSGGIPSPRTHLWHHRR